MLLFLALLAPSALANPATAVQAVNVRAGPGTAFNVVDVLFEGELVEITGCEGRWCQIEHSGPDGWVSARYLNQDPDAAALASGEGSDAPATPTFEFSLGEGPRPPNWRPQVCFYNAPAFSGAGACIDVGTRDMQLTGYWDDRITSVRLTAGASVILCSGWFLEDHCETLTESTAQLGTELNNQVSSYLTEPLND